MRALIFALLLLFTGCAGLGMKGGVGDDDLKTIRKVAVFSRLPSTMNHITIGFTALANKYQTIDVSKWRMTQFGENQVVAQLSRNSQYKVGTIKNKPKPDASWDKDAVASLQAEAKNEGYDTLVILEPSGYANAPLFKPGYGVARVSRVGSPRISAYMIAIISVYNTSKPEALGWDWAMFDSSSADPSGGAAQVPPWKDDPAGFSADELGQIELLLKHRIELQVAEALKGNHLIK